MDTRAPSNAGNPSVTANSLSLRQSSNPLYVMRERMLTINNVEDYRKPFDQVSPVELGYALVHDYKLGLIKALLQAHDCDVLELKSTNASTNGKEVTHPSIFVRDAIVVLHDKKIILVPSLNQQSSQPAICSVIPEELGYKIVCVPDTYFEGGNVFYLPNHKILLHGNNPAGHYPYRSDQTKTNTNIQKYLTAEGSQIQVLGLSINPKLNEYDRTNDYYHLDCFMQTLPDGRVVILNKNILDNNSFTLLKNLLGEQLIDLNYEKYLTRPFYILNFIAVGHHENTAVLCPDFPVEIVKALQKHNIKVVTPDVIDSRKECFDAALSERVAFYLRQDGYQDAASTSLTTHVPKNIKGYKLLNTGEHLTNEFFNKAVGSSWMPLDEFISRRPLNFKHGSGGMHCLTHEIFPGVVLDKNSLSPYKTKTVLFPAPEEKACFVAGIDQISEKSPQPPQ